jgi:hypothetical protein
VGATLYHAAAGKLPFPATSLAELLAWIADRPPVPLGEVIPGIDPRLTAVLERAMARDPSRRFQSAREMQAALAPLLASANPQGTAAHRAETRPLTSDVASRSSTAEGSVGPFATSVHEGRSSVATGPHPHMQSARSHVHAAPTRDFPRAPSPAHPGYAPQGPPPQPMPAAGASQQVHVQAQAQQGQAPVGRSTPTWPWLFALFGGVSLVLLGGLFALGLRVGGKTTDDPQGDPPSDWSEVRGHASSKCAPRRWAVHGSGKLDFHPLEADEAAGLSSQLGQAIDGCGRDCPGPTSYMVRIYNDGRVGEVSEPVELCPSRDECVRKALVSRHVGAPPHDADAVVELTCTFP